MHMYVYGLNSLLVVSFLVFVFIVKNSIRLFLSTIYREIKCMCVHIDRTTITRHIKKEFLNVYYAYNYMNDDDDDRRERILND